MNSRLALSFVPPPAQAQRLAELQAVFAAACNHLSPIVQQTRCWNRVALHHMVYRSLREHFPALGSQMACNAIYSVSRTCRAVYQGRQSPYSLQKLAGRPLPRVMFLPHSPVYFDRHTLSLKDSKVSMYTMDGRIRFAIDLTPEQEARFRQAKLREIVMSANGPVYRLDFSFAPDDEAPGDDEPHKETDMPEYVLVIEGAAPDSPVPQDAAEGPAANRRGANA